MLGQRALVIQRRGETDCSISTRLPSGRRPEGAESNTGRLRRRRAAREGRQPHARCDVATSALLVPLVV
jgi:hypothetical protein